MGMCVEVSGSSLLGNTTGDVSFARMRGILGCASTAWRLKRGIFGGERWRADYHEQRTVFLLIFIQQGPISVGPCFHIEN